MNQIPTRDRAAEVIAAMAERIPDDEIREHQILRAILYMTAALLDDATDDELITFAAYIQHFGIHHCAAFTEKEDGKTIH